MELDDLKNTWDNQSNKEEQQNLTSKLIDQMTQEKYNSKINKIAYPEIIGSLICLIAIIYIGINFYKLDSNFLKGVGIISILVLMTLSIVSLLSLRQLKMTKDFNRPYAETLRIFATQKLEFYKLQKINMTLSYLLLVTIIILISKFFNNRDITDSKYFWTFSFSFGYIFLLFLSKFVTKFYKTTLTKTEELLQELGA
jgi:hypothetical protein